VLLAEKKQTSPFPGITRKGERNIQEKSFQGEDGRDEAKRYYNKNV
jgi:hypothetical protein